MHFPHPRFTRCNLVSGKSYLEILTELKDLGLGGLPGGGAELLVDSVRKRVSPKKIRAGIWLEIMKSCSIT